MAASVLGVTDPEGDAIQIVIDAIYQDESVDADDDGNAFEVRAERSGQGDGRVYHVMFTALDATGSCSGEVLIRVPLNQHRGGVAVDGGALYDSTAYERSSARRAKHHPPNLRGPGGASSGAVVTICRPSAT